MRSQRVVCWTVLCAALGALGGEASTAQSTARPHLAAATALLDVWIEEHRVYHGWPGVSVAVVQGGEVIWSRGYGFADLDTLASATPDTLYRIGSVSKVVTATAVVLLRDRGLLALEDPVTRFLPELAIENPFPDSGLITIRQLLTHTAGLPREGAFPYWSTHVFPSTEEVLAATANQRLIYPPGTTYKYSNLGVGLLGAILERASGSSYPELLRGILFEPLGMARSTAAPDPALRAELAAAYMRREPDGTRRRHDYYDTGGVAAAANVVSSVHELARFVGLHLGSFPEILGEASRGEMHRLQFIYPSWSGGRGLGFAVSREGGRERISHGGWIGGHRAQVLLSPSESLGVVVMTNADDVSPFPVARKVLEQISEAVARETKGREMASVDPWWPRYVGRYGDPWGWEYRVMVLADELVMYDHSYPPADDPSAGITRLTPVAQHRFRMDDGEEVRFELGADGEVVRVVRRYEPLERLP